LTTHYEKTASLHFTLNQDIPLGEAENACVEGQLLASAHRTKAQSCWTGLGEFSGHAANAFLTDEGQSR
jgi:hypothetical protein